MKRPTGPIVWVALVVVVVVAGGLWLWRRHRPAPAKPAAVVENDAPPASLAPPAPTETTIAKRQTFSAAAAQLSLDAGLTETLVRTARPVYNLARIQAGHTLTLTRTAAGAPSALAYQIDANRTLWLRADDDGNWSAKIETIPYTTELVGVSGTVASSLFQAVESAGERDPLAVELADIFAWDLDFYTDPRVGDVFRVLVEKRFLQGKFAGYGQIVAAEYVNAGKPYEALRFHDDLGLLAYYQPNGQPMKREFLRSPLKFAARISSGFSRDRYHPILKIYRPHLGTDFAAPTGTPVQTIGAGVVVYAARKGEDGNLVQIRHSGGYQTLYMHLSRILVHVGQRVAQGQTVGLVGMTGLATGPHLDFRIEHDGEFENFEVLRLKLPPAAPVARGLMTQFAALRAKYMPQLEQLQPAASAATAASGR